MGSGDIGLIMARRMTLEGAKVLCVAELMPYSGGAEAEHRPVSQRLRHPPEAEPHGGWTSRARSGSPGVTIAAVDEKLKPIPGTEEHFDCDTLLLSVGLIPENELSRQVGVQLSPVTNGPKVNESLETNLPGVFACGNVLHVHDLVDYVSEEAVQAGRNAARYLLEGRSPEAEGNPPYGGRGGALHRALHPLPPAHGGGDRGCASGWAATCGTPWCGSPRTGRSCCGGKRPVMAPGEMEQVKLKREWFTGQEKEIVVEALEAKEAQ